VRSYRSGRTCGHSACDTILSIYNPSMYCWAHDALASGRRAHGAQRPTREVTCENCATLFSTGNAARKFCSDSCRMAAFARRKRKAIHAERPQQRAQARPTIDRPVDATTRARSSTPAMPGMPASATGA
jgi:hypothetical protein